MRSVKNPFLYLLSCLAVIIYFSMLVRGPWRSEAISANSTDPSDPVANSGARENAKLKLDLKWRFGAKPQHGWYLYTPLIQSLLNTSAAPETSAFAQALSGWQRSEGLAPTGALDQETWMKMVAVFQSRRIKDRSAPSSRALTLVPASEFFDPERPQDLRYVERQAYAAYKRLVAAASAELSLSSDDNWLKIISAYRSPAYQARLRRQSPRSGREGLAINSPHFTGRALDIYVGGEPVSTNDKNRAKQVNTKVYQWLVKNAGRFGFYPYFYEPWHWEYRP
ncbi:MAG: D-alanyl-D-alanine carboxypeptidase family protein [Chloracidobacterium sp.]|nr:D-alanyl-D-alanine carboxypeptidase family protein [Chloracidobacterium sp.]